MELVIVNDGKATTTSLKVAEYFGKQHKDVIRSVDNLLKDQDVFARRNFALSDYQDSTGRTLPMYKMDRDGFTLLAMGFTGKKALTFKMNYIDAFNKAEDALKTSLPVIHDPKTLALMQLLAKTDALEFEQENQKKQLNQIEDKVEAITPGLAAHTINLIQGDISKVAKLYRTLQHIKQKPITHPDAQRHITAIVLAEFSINDIAYIKDASAVLRFLQGMHTNLQTEYDNWFAKNNLFSKAN